MPESTSGHSTIKTQLGIISCGGWSDYRWNGYTNKCWKLSSSNEWGPFPSMNQKRANFGMGEGMGKIFLVGGSGDSSSMEWIMIDDGKNWVKQDLPFSVHTQCISKYNDTHLLLTGGVVSDKQQSRWKVKC